MAPMIIIMGLGPFLKWKRGDALTAIRRLKFAAGIAVIGLATVWYIIDKATVLAAFGIGLAIWLLFSTLTELSNRIHLFKAPWSDVWRRITHQPRSSWGMTFAHAGLALAIAGMTASSAWRVEAIQSMKPNDTVVVSGFKFALKNVQTVKGPNYMASRGTFEVSRGKSFKIILEPEKRMYTVGRQQTTEAAIYPTFLGDLYAVIGDPDDKGSFITRIYFNPLVSWMWVGVIVMVFGAGISLSDRRHRVGAPFSRRSPGGATVKS